MKDWSKDAVLFQALADPTRLKIVRLLADPKNCGCDERAGGARALCVNAIAKHAGVTQSAVSQHLRLLRQAGLVRGERKGSFVHYSLDEAGLKAVRSRMEEVLKTAR